MSNKPILFSRQLLWTLFVDLNLVFSHVLVLMYLLSLFIMRSSASSIIDSTQLGVALEIRVSKCLALVCGNEIFSKSIGYLQCFGMFHVHIEHRALSLWTPFWLPSFGFWSCVSHSFCLKKIVQWDHSLGRHPVNHSLNVEL